MGITRYTTRTVATRSLTSVYLSLSVRCSSYLRASRTRPTPCCSLSPTPSPRSLAKVPPWRCQSSAPAPPQCVRAWWLGATRRSQGEPGHWTPSNCITAARARRLQSRPLRLPNPNPNPYPYQASEPSLHLTVGVDTHLWSLPVDLNPNPTPNPPPHRGCRHAPMVTLLRLEPYP